MSTLTNLKKHFFKTMAISSALIASVGLAAEVTSSKSGTLTISAFVEEVISIRIAAKMSKSKLDLSITQTDLPVATVVETSNSSTGYIVKARSENNSNIKNINGNGAVPYTLKYGGGDSVLLSQSDKILREENLGGIYSSQEKEVTISFKGSPLSSLASGLYNDVITFTIESK